MEARANFLALIAFFLACSTSISALADGQSAPTPGPPQAPSYPSSAPTSNFSIGSSTPKILIHYNLGPYSDRHFPVVGGKPAKCQKIVIEAKADWPFFPTADVKFSLPYGKGKVPLVYTIHGAKFDKQHYTVTTAQLGGFAFWVVSQIEMIQRGFDANTPIPAVAGVAVTIIPLYSNPSGKLREFTVDGSFEVDFQQVVPASGDVGATLQGLIPAQGSASKESESPVPTQSGSPADESAGVPPNVPADSPVVKAEPRAGSGTSVEPDPKPPHPIAPAAPASPPESLAPALPPG